MIFDNMTDIEFENFCYDLLHEIGLHNVSWRKGTGEKSSPSDNGRDIECEYCHYDAILQKSIIEKWFVECKHYNKGVPFKELNGALSWANAECPDRLIIVVSNFLSNPCKNALKDYIQNSKPRYKIEIWEKVFIEKKALAFPHLLKKYNIEYREQILDCLNPIHVEYMKKPPFNALSQLFDAIKKLELVDLKDICEICSISYAGEFDDLKKIFGSGDIVAFIKNKILSVSKSSEQFAVQSFILTALQLILPNANIYGIDDMVLKNENWVQSSIKNKAKIIEKMKQMDSQTDTSFINDEQIRTLLHQSPEKIREKTTHMYELYSRFCNIVLTHLLEHQYDEILDNKDE